MARPAVKGIKAVKSSLSLSYNNFFKNDNFLFNDIRLQDVT